MRESPVRPNTVKAALFVVFVMMLVILPFVIFAEELEGFMRPLLESREQQVGALTVIAIVLLACDSVAPVPSTFVIIFLAWKGGALAGIIGGTIGMSAGVLTAAWIGRAAVGRLAPRFFPAAEIVRMREALQRHLVVTLACLRSVPVLAETSVIIAASTGIPVRKIFWVTLLPNLVISIIYSIAADESFLTACITFVATLAISYVVWRVLRRETVPG